MVTLRTYQANCVDALRSTYQSGLRAPTLVLPTGAGKTAIFAHITRGVAERGNRTLILAHRRELVAQASAKLKDYDVKHAVCMPGYGACSRDTVVVGSVQTVVRRLSQLGPFRWVVLDESHHAISNSYRTILTAHPQARLLGVTATPCRLDGQGLGMSCGGFFDSLVEGPSMRWLQENMDPATGLPYLAPLIVYAPQISLDQVRLRKRAGEFVAEDDAALMDRPAITGDAIDHYRRYADGEKGIAFSATVLHGRHVAEAFCAAGIPAEMIDGSLKTRDRDAMLRRFRDSITRILVSCELIGEGVDIPDASVGIDLRHTMSLTVYRQHVGRIMRPGPGKTAIYLDHVGNTQRHGLPDEDIEWSLDGKPNRKKPETAEGVDIWRCAHCYCICRSEQTQCPQCGAAKPKQERKLPRTVAGELAQVTRPWEKIGISYEEYVATVVNREQERIKWDTEFFSRVARQKGYKPGWVHYRVTARSEARMKAAQAGHAQLFDYSSEK